MEFYVTTHGVLRWLHVLAMVYWLGGEWGVFNTSRYVTNMNLSLDERRRHMDTAFRIDILARLGIILLLPLGIHMGYDLGVQPLGGPWITATWIFFGAWLCLTLAAFFTHQSDLGLRLTRIDEALRYFDSRPPGAGSHGALRRGPARRALVRVQGHAVRAAARHRARAARRDAPLGHALSQPGLGSVAISGGSATRPGNLPRPRTRVFLLDRHRNRGILRRGEAYRIGVAACG